MAIKCFREKAYAKDYQRILYCGAMPESHL